MIQSRYQPVVASLFSLTLLALPFGPVRAAPAPEEVASAVAAAGAYDYGKSSAPWRAIDRFVNQTRGDAELRAALENALAKLLESDASLACKQEACRRLWIVGSEAAVLALAKLFSSSDTQLVEAACYALSPCPAKAAGQALRGALAQAQGAGLAAVITVLGDRRDAQADATIASLAGSREAVVADAALAALGKIATPLAVAKLREGLAGDAARQASAAAALLQAGQEMARHGDASAARKVFQELALAPQRHIRRGALLGRIQLGGAEAVPLVLAALGDQDEALQAAAIAGVSNLRGPDTIGTIAAQLSKLPAQQQARLIEALAACHGAAALPAIMHAAEHPDVGVRIAAIKALGTLGDAGCVSLLVKACGAQNPEEAKVAALTLRMLKGSTVNAAIVGRLGMASPEVKVKLIAVLADRRATDAVAPLIVQARDGQPSVRVAAWRALGKVAQQRDLPALIQLLAELKDDTVRTDGQRAVARVAQSITDPAHRGDLLLAAWDTARETSLRCSLLRVLGGVGGARALAAVFQAVQATDPAVKDAAVAVLARWPDPQAANLLLDLLKRSPNPTHRALALEGYVRLLDRMHDQPARDKVRRYVEVMALSHRPEDARLILSGLSRVVDPAALEAICRFHDPAVANEVAIAAIAVARQLPLLDLEAIDAAMKTVAAGGADEALRREAAGLLVPLFDGQSFAGWEGNLKTFRIEDGAVVGGSLRQGLPHNEFLCTTKPYGNFELRLKCKLVGSRANGGIQFRSQRIPNHHEVRGYQADMAAGAWGTIYDESRRGRVLAGPSAQQQRAIVRADGWNDYVIRCQGRHIQLWLNGHLTADYTEPDAALPQRGIIGLQIHGGPPAEAWYKDLVLRLLPEN